MVSIDYILAALSALLLLSILATMASTRLGVPALLVFLALGMAVGPEGPGGIMFDDVHTAQSLGVIALVMILFAGGLDTDLQDIRSAWKPAIALSTLGIFISTLLVAAFAMVIFGLDPLYAILLAAIVSSTDAAAVFSVLRTRGIRLSGSLRPLIEIESCSNDPMAVFLTLASIHLIQQPDMAWSVLGLLFAQQMIVGTIFGYCMGRVMIAGLARIVIDYEGLAPVFSIGTMFLTYSASTIIGGSGFLAVYILGLVVGSAGSTSVRQLARFHDGLAWLMQIAMFLALGILVPPSQLAVVGASAVVLAIFLMLVARPASVFLSLALSELTISEKFMVSWVGLRGAVPIVLATFPLLEGIPHAETMFPLVFFVVVTSVLLQGMTLPFVARALGVLDEGPAHVPYPLEFIPKHDSKSDLIEVSITRGARAEGLPISDLGLPAGSLITLVKRSGEFLVPSGQTLLKDGDSLLILVTHEDVPAVRTLFAMPETAAI